MTRYPARWVVAVLALAASLGVALSVALGWALDWAEPSDRSDRATGVVSGPGAAPSHEPWFSVGPAPDPLPPAAVLHQWDRRRAMAYARGDPAALAALYVAGSGAGTSDVALLRDYRRRGLHVENLRMQLFAVEVLDHAPGRWRLRVTDRVDGAVAVGAHTRVPLPRDQASTRVVTLRRTQAGAAWKVVAVTR